MKLNKFKTLQLQLIAWQLSRTAQVKYGLLSCCFVH